MSAPIRLPAGKRVVGVHRPNNNPLRATLYEGILVEGDPEEGPLNDMIQIAADYFYLASVDTWVQCVSTLIWVSRSSVGEPYPHW